jgi:hypothetical protein
LNLSKSFMGAEHPQPDYELTKVFEQNGVGLKMIDHSVHGSIANIPLPDSTETLELNPGGPPQKGEHAPMFPGLPPSNFEVTANWEGGTLFLIEHSQGLTGPVLAKRRYFLSEDCSQLIELVESYSTLGDSEQRLIFDRQADH